MRLLQRTRPGVDERVLREASVPRERLLRRPRAKHELDRFLVALARLDRRNPVVEVGVVTQTDRQPGHEPAPAQAVEHRVLLGDPQRLAGLAERATQHDQRRLGPLGADRVRQHRRRQVGVRHHVVRRLPVLRDRDPVEPGAHRGEHLVHEPAVRVEHPLRFDEFGVRRRDHGRDALILETLPAETDTAPAGTG